MISLYIIPQSDTHYVVDASKLTEYMACARRYFFHYVLGWQRNSPNNHLIFGTAWHLAMEHLLLNNYTQEALEEASLLFLSSYRQHFDPSTDGMFTPKDPENALVALQAYAQKFSQDVREYKTLHTEIGGVVMISPINEMHFKIDWMGQERKSKKILYIDHKTSQRKYSDWGSHWTLSTQMLLYRHVLHCLYPSEELTDSLVRCSFFYIEPKKERDFRAIHGGERLNNAEFEQHPIAKSNDQMQAWLVRTNHWYDALQHDMVVLTHEDDSSNMTMESFPQNDNACFSYGTQCPYFDFCNSFSNPLRLAQRGVPLGFRQEFWDPRDQPTMREKVDLR